MIRAVIIDDEINKQDKYKLVRAKCRTFNESCIEWAIDGWCEKINNNSDDDDDDDFNIMIKTDCAPICRLCHELHITAKCPLPHPNDVKNGKKLMS